MSTRDHVNDNSRLIKRPKVSRIVCDDLRSRIESGEFSAGELLTPEYQLAEEYGVSRGTIRAALQELVNDGVVITKHGSGSYVSSGSADINFNICDLTSMSSIIKRTGIEPEMKYLSRQIRKVTSDEATRLRVNEDNQVLELKRQVEADKKMAIFSFDIVRADLLPSSLDLDMINGSLFKFLESLDCKISYASCEISAAVGKDFGLYGEAKMDSFIGLSQLHYDINDLPIFYSRTFFRNEIFSFSLMRKKKL